MIPRRKPNSALVFVAALVMVTLFVLSLFVQPASPADSKKSPRYLLAVKLQHALVGTPMQNLGFILEAEGYRANISPYFIVGAAGTESGEGRNPGRYGCSGNKYNVWGLGACGRAWNEPHFVSWRHAIRYYVDFINHYWPKAQTVYDLHGYCPPCGSRAWGAQTYAWMLKMFGNVTYSIKYPR